MLHNYRTILTSFLSIGIKLFVEHTLIKKKRLMFLKINFKQQLFLKNPF